MSVGNIMKIDRTLLKTGIPLIDEQHDAYFTLVEQLLGICQREDVTSPTLESELDKVLAYAVDHFDAEEHLMRSADYPYYEQHLAKHNQFREQVDEFYAGLRSERPTQAYTTRLTEWLIHWITHQIGTDDQKLAAYLKATKQLAPGPARKTEAVFVP